ncbi:MAG: hypothetical protein D6808_01670 [Candidatus Dadabacteria bacterium]|nr:MAG: hypothetical protein D6808_01670 [Candidatus Dadabacteria bacterium]
MWKGNFLPHIFCISYCCRETTFLKAIWQPQGGKVFARILCAMADAYLMHRSKVAEIKGICPIKTIVEAVYAYGRKVNKLTVFMGLKV